MKSHLIMSLDLSLNFNHRLPDYLQQLLQPNDTRVCDWEFLFTLGKSERERICSSDCRYIRMKSETRNFKRSSSIQCCTFNRYMSWHMLLLSPTYIIITYPKSTFRHEREPRIPLFACAVFVDGADCLIEKNSHRTVRLKSDGSRPILPFKFFCVLILLFPPKFS